MTAADRPAPCPTCNGRTWTYADTGEDDRCPTCASTGEAPAAPAPSEPLAEVAKERDRQDAKWGEQNHDPLLWVAVLTEEVGGAAQAALQSLYGGCELSDYRYALIQVAAVAVAMVESLDRGKWTWGNHAND